MLVRPLDKSISGQEHPSARFADDEIDGINVRWQLSAVYTETLARQARQAFAPQFAQTRPIAINFNLELFATPGTHLWQTTHLKLAMRSEQSYMNRLVL